MTEPVAGRESTDELVQRARHAREHAHAPYSGFAVGAALRSGSGLVYSGSNIENLSFGLTICAERVALFSAVAAGERSIRSLVIVADSNEPIVPCGACRQVLAEFAPELRIRTFTLDGKSLETSLAELLPRATQGILDKTRST